MTAGATFLPSPSLRSCHFLVVAAVSYALAQERYFKRVRVSIMAVAAWETSWTRSPDTWVDYPNSLQQAFNTFKNIEDEVPRLRDYAQQFGRLNEMPWRAIAREIADGVNRQDERLESANAMMGVGQIRDYVDMWRTECSTVEKLITWQLFPSESGAKILKEFSRPGAYEQPALC